MPALHTTTMPNIRSTNESMKQLSLLKIISIMPRCSISLFFRILLGFFAFAFRGSPIRPFARCVLLVLQINMAFLMFEDSTGPSINYDHLTCLDPLKVAAASLLSLLFFCSRELSAFAGSSLQHANTMYT
jgi:hypothetical protein